PNLQTSRQVSKNEGQAGVDLSCFAVQVQRYNLFPLSNDTGFLTSMHQWNPGEDAASGLARLDGSQRARSLLFAQSSDEHMEPKPDLRSGGQKHFEQRFLSRSRQIQ